MGVCYYIYYLLYSSCCRMDLGRYLISVCFLIGSSKQSSRLSTWKIQSIIMFWSTIEKKHKTKYSKARSKPITDIQFIYVQKSSKTHSEGVVSVVQRHNQHMCRCTEERAPQMSGHPLILWRLPHQAARGTPISIQVLAQEVGPACLQQQNYRFKSPNHLIPGIHSFADLYLIIDALYLEVHALLWIISVLGQFYKSCKTMAF